MKFDTKKLEFDIQKIVEKHLKRKKVSHNEELHTEFELSIDKFGNFELKMPSYLIFADKGRKAGTPPPVKSIMKWLENRGFHGKKMESHAYAIAKNISKMGVRGKNFLKDMNDEIEGYIKDNLAKYIIL